MAQYSARAVDRIRRSRRHPRVTQFDYLHLRALVRDLREALGRVAAPGGRVLDVYCGSRPYDDLLPPATELVGLDVEGNPYGVADVVSNDFLPFPDDSFDLVMIIQAFDYVAEPQAAVDEFLRVLRPGGAVLLTVPLVWEYDRTELVHRYSGPQLAALFVGWESVEVRESGGRAVAWATLTGSLVNSLTGRVPVVRTLAGGIHAVLNGLGALLDVLERRYARSTHTLPMNLLLVARSPG